MTSIPNREEQYNFINLGANHINYTRDFQISDAISAGDLTLLQTITADWFNQDTPFTSSPWEHIEEIDWYKLQLKCLNRSCRVAAYEGGLIKQSLFLISKIFNILIESGQSTEFLNTRVFHVICKKYCQAVNRLSTLHMSDLMKDILLYVNDHLTEDLTLQMIAKQFELHPVHLARKFKKEVGMTFIEYMNYQKVEYAKYLFYLDQYSLSDVAYLSGFNSHSYFTKVFKKVTGLTPTQFVKEHLHYY